MQWEDIPDEFPDILRLLRALEEVLAQGTQSTHEPRIYLRLAQENLRLAQLSWTRTWQPDLVEELDA